MLRIILCVCFILALGAAVAFAPKSTHAARTGTVQISQACCGDPDPH